MPSLLLLVSAIGLLGGGCHHKHSEPDGGQQDFAMSDLGHADFATPVDFGPTCGNGVIDPNETCDDGNDKAGDGCSSTCQVELGWQCPSVGVACMREVYCGDGIVESPETCDDGNSIPGDGCSGTCQLEPNYACSTPSPAPNPAHEVCTSTIICGDGKVELGEACDDGNTKGGDGCSADCSTIEPGYTCISTTTPGTCTLAPPDCPNGKIDPGEQCDTGSANSTGCTNCMVDPGYTCNLGPNRPCSKIKFCGDDILSGSEACDDGNMMSGDGCSSTCQIEANYACTAPTLTSPPMPSVCTSTVVCGDGKVTGSEQCDDGNTKSNDGCSSTCQLQMGWTCPNPGVACVAKQCGDGVVAGNEQCDAGTSNNGAPPLGCSSACTINPGNACALGPNGMTSVCHATVCGDGNKEGAEQCDDNNLVPFDGCSPTCTFETTCTGGSCAPTCGDGLVFPPEQCDDGNTTNGDGCSSTCMQETGWMCALTTAAPSSSITIPILYRDMLYASPYSGTTAPGPGHPDFEHFSCSYASTGLVSTTLGTDNKPVFAGTTGTTPPPNGTSACSAQLTGKTYYDWWYHDVDGSGTPNPFDQLVYQNADGSATTLTLPLTGTNTYKFASSGLGFFPIDGLGWDSPTFGNPQTSSPNCDPSLSAQNFSFTSELHYVFTYDSAQASSSTTAPVFSFTGDDDVWAFIAGQLVVDLGGLHSALTASYTLNASTVEQPVGTNGGLGLVDGHFYSIDLFQAERHTCASNYALTLQGFNHTTSVCTPICGDGKIEGNEVCDLGSVEVGSNPGAGNACAAPGLLADGNRCIGSVEVGDNPGAGNACTEPGMLADGNVCTSNNTGTTYNGCATDCSARGPFCGDHHTDGPPSTGNGPEYCDDGTNLTTYGGTSSNACAPGCVFAPYCGDGIVSNTETCDDGVNNGTAGDPCTTTCSPAASCGDGIVNGNEQCDDGVNNGTPGDTCSSNCALLCGNGTLDPGEACDKGAALNTGGYNGCNSDCTLSAHCGDGVKNGAEQCDNGTNSGAYGSCNANCTLASYCGDGVVNASGGEQCDCGASAQTLSSQCTSVNSQTAYGAGKCTTGCQTAPYCGDGIVESSFGEQCDGSPGCSSMCKTTIN